jgi:hypothetical protein
MAFTRWVRAVSEKQLMTAAQTKVAKRYGLEPPPRPSGGDLFWQRVYAPVFYALPVGLRDRVAATMPGSHRRTWHPAAQASGPAASLVREQSASKRPAETASG